MKKNNKKNNRLNFYNFLQKKTIRLLLKLRYLLLAFRKPVKIGFLRLYNEENTIIPCLMSVIDMTDIIVLIYSDIEDSSLELVRRYIKDNRLEKKFIIRRYPHKVFTQHGGGKGDQLRQGHVLLFKRCVHFLGKLCIELGIEGSHIVMHRITLQKLVGLREKIADYVTFLHAGKLLLTKPKDELLWKYGVLRCGEEQFQKLDGSEVLAWQKKDYSYDVLVPDREELLRRYPEAVVDRATMDEILLLYIPIPT